MSIYSIRDLEKLTGVRKHTIRIWEQRYGLIEPRRTATNIRFYTDEDLRHLFNIALLNRNGFKISKLAKLSSAEIAHIVSGISEKNDNPNTQIDKLTLTMLYLDEAEFEQIFASHIQSIGFERTMGELIYPLLENLKALWMTRSISPAHEKFISHLIRRKMLCAIDAIPLKDYTRDSITFFLYLPESESQELTLLYMNYILRQRNHRVIYLGPATSLSDLKDACSTLKPNFVFTMLDAPLSRQSVQHYIDHAAQSVNGAQILLTGAQVFINPLRLPENVRILSGLHDTLQFLDQVKNTVPKL